MPPATTSQAALANLQSYQAGSKTPDQLTQDANKQYGVDAAGQQVSGLRQAISKTTGLLKQVAPSVYGRTQNSLVTNAQATRQIGNETAPIQQDLQNLGTQYSDASSDYDKATSQASQQAQLGYQGQQGQLSYLQQIYQNLAAGEQSQRDEAFRQQQAVDSRSAASSGGASPSFGALSSILGENTSGQSSVQDHFGADLSKLLPSDYANRFLPGYTERTVIPKLKSLYPEFNENQIKQMVYGYRKQFETPTAPATGKDLYGRTQVMA